MPPKSNHYAHPRSLMYNTSCYRDPRTQEFVIIPKTDVIVQNANGTLTEHLTKELHVFAGPVFRTPASPGSPASAMMDKLYWQFKTGHDKWPYMFVQKSAFIPKAMTATEIDNISCRA